MGAKATPQLIPLCHPLMLQRCNVRPDASMATTSSSCARLPATAPPGVEMEALTGASIAALTVYDMCKAMSHDIVIREMRLLHKSGGKRDVDNWGWAT